MVAGHVVGLVGVELLDQRVIGVELCGRRLNLWSCVVEDGMAELFVQLVLVEQGQVLFEVEVLLDLIHVHLVGVAFICFVVVVVVAIGGVVTGMLTVLGFSFV